jgi:DNA-binding HxlR family transcriptional regulator
MAGRAHAAHLPADDAALKALQAAVEVLNAKWSILVLARLSRGTLRFSELLRAVDGVSRRMLSATLKQLERDGLVERRVYALVPARVEYELSDAGRDFLEALAPLADWGRSHRVDIARARERYDTLLRVRAQGDALHARSHAGRQQPMY